MAKKACHVIVSIEVPYFEYDTDHYKKELYTEETKFPLEFDANDPESIIKFELVENSEFLLHLLELEHRLWYAKVEEIAINEKKE